MRCQLDMTPDMKRWIVEAHDFYVSQVKQRVIAQFRDIEGEAKRYAQSEYERLGSRPSWGDDDMGAVAELAHDNTMEFYRLLAELRRSVILGALAGLYHQWEKQLRDFIEMELTHDMPKTEAKQKAWSSEIGKTFDLLSEVGWDVRAAPFFSGIDACRLVVNVYKHGQGQSLSALNEKYSEYLPDPLPIAGMDRSANVHHEWLSLSEKQFVDIADCLRAFWQAFPDRLKR